ncbi:MAG: inverse autotransporter beta domain-containing protein [Gammaproteobacteria bacterium]
MMNKMLKGVSFAGIGFCLLVGVFAVGGDAVRAEDGAHSPAQTARGQTSAADAFGRAFGRTFRQTGQTFQQSFNLRDIAVDAANGVSAGDSLSAFRRNAQLRMLALLDGELSGLGEQMLVSGFVARRADIDFQSPLGGRDWHLGVDLAGDFAGAAGFADIDDDIFGWQMRVYAGEPGNGGLNSGIFYRRIFDGEMLVGGNIFADYEHHEYGSFVRYSFGGEVRNRHFSLAANYYVPLTGERMIGMHNSRKVVAFSRQGYDAKVRIDAPQLFVNVPHLQGKFRDIKAGLDYYNFEGEHGREADDGFRFGGEWHPDSAWRVGLFYDTGEGTHLGGEIAYQWTIGEVQSRTSGGAGFDLDLLAPVQREHSQRIVLATMGDEVFAWGIPRRDDGIGIVSIPSTVTVGTVFLSDDSADSVSPGAAANAYVAAAGGGAAVGNVGIIPAFVSVISPQDGSLLDGFYFMAANSAVIFTATRMTPQGFITANIAATRSTFAITLEVIPPLPPRYTERRSGDVFLGVHTIGVLDVGNYFDDILFVTVSLSDDASASRGNIVLTARALGERIISIAVNGEYGGNPTVFTFAHTLNIVRDPNAQAMAAVANPAPVWLHWDSRDPLGGRREVGTVTVINPTEGVSYTYSLLVRSGRGNGTGTCGGAGDGNAGNGTDCRFELTTSTGELSFLHNDEGRIVGTIVVRGADLFASVFVTVQSYRPGDCVYHNCPAVGISTSALPTRTQISLLNRSAVYMSGNGTRWEYNRQGSIAVPFFNSRYNQTQVSIVWQYMKSIGATPNTQFFQHGGGEGGEADNGLWALDFANRMNTGGRLNWFTENNTTAQCRFICRIGQRQAPETSRGIPGGICVRDIEKQTGFSTRDIPLDCTMPEEEVES